MRCEAIDAIIVGIETQEKYLTITKKEEEEEEEEEEKKKQKKWTRKIVLLTDGESPIAVEGWLRTTKELKSLVVNTTIMLGNFGFPTVPFANTRSQRH